MGVNGFCDYLFFTILSYNTVGLRHLCTRDVRTERKTSNIVSKRRRSRADLLQCTRLRLCGDHGGTRSEGLRSITARTLDGRYDCRLPFLAGPLPRAASSPATEFEKRSGVRRLRRVSVTSHVRHVPEYSAAPKRRERLSTTDTTQRRYNIVYNYCRRVTRRVRVCYESFDVCRSRV